MQGGAYFFKLNARHRTPPYTLTSTLDEFELFAAHLTDARPGKVNTPYFDPCLDIGLTGDFNLKILNMN